MICANLWPSSILLDNSSGCRTFTPKWPMSSLNSSRDSGDLTEVAQQALHAEFAKRQLIFPELQATVAPASVNKPVEPIAAQEESEQPEDGECVDFRDLVEVRRFRDLLDAEMAKGALDSAGIESFLGDDNMVRMDWFYSNAIGGVKLMVHPQDANAAQHVLDQPIPESIEFAEGEHYEQPRCPKCGSLNVSYKNIDEATAFGSAAIGVPLPYTSDRWECNDCEAKWEDDEEEDPEDGSQE